MSIFAQQQVGTKKKHPNILEQEQFKTKCYLYSVNIRDPTDMAPLATTTRKTFRITLKCDSKTKETPWSFTIEAMLVFKTVNDFGEGPGSYVFTHNFFNTGTVNEKVYDNCEPIFFEDLMSDSEMYNQHDDSVDLIIGIKKVEVFNGLRSASPHHMAAENAKWNSEGVEHYLKCMVIIRDMREITIRFANYQKSRKLIGFVKTRLDISANDHEAQTEGDDDEIEGYIATVFFKRNDKPCPIPGVAYCNIKKRRICKRKKF